MNMNKEYQRKFTKQYDSSTQKLVTLIIILCNTFKVEYIKPLTLIMKMFSTVLILCNTFQVEWNLAVNKVVVTCWVAEQWRKLGQCKTRPFLALHVSTWGEIHKYQKEKNWRFYNLPILMKKCKESDNTMYYCGYCIIGQNILPKTFCTVISVH